MEILSDLINFSMNNGIAVEIRRDLAPSVPSMSFPQIKKIMVNANNHDYIFQFAHEMGHILNDDSSLAPLCFSANNRSKLEVAANRTAIKILMPFYCDSREPYMARSTEFINIFNAPSWLNYIVCEEISKYYTISGNALI